MSTSIDAQPRRGSRGRWIAVAVVVLAAVAVAVLLRGFGSGSSAKPPTLPNQLADRVVAILEQSTPAQHHDHGHGEVGQGTVVCAAKTLGFDPPGATTVAEVRTFYGYHLCGVAEPGRPWDYSVKLSGPLSVQLTEPPVVRVAEGGTGYPERVREIIPTPYQEEALQALLDDDDMRELRSRFDDAADG